MAEQSLSDSSAAGLPFESPYRHGFLRVAIGAPRVAVADPARNLEATLELARRASELQAAVALFPELGLSAYTNDDLFHQDALLEAAEESLAQVVAASRDLTPVILVGVPLRQEDRLFNCAAVVYDGELLGLAPKSYLPNYREFYERRQFAPAAQALSGTAVFRGALRGTRVPFGNDLIFEAEGLPGFALHAEICEDLWVPVPPSTWAALGGATVLCNLSASNITVDKASFRKDLAAAQSGRCLAAYLYAAAGAGESTTDLAWDGHALIYENDDLLAESERFAPAEDGPQLIHADLDLERLGQERMRLTTWGDSVEHHRERLRALRRVPFRFQVPARPMSLARVVERFPYVPRGEADCDERCFEAYQIQVHGLEQRLRATGIEKVVIGVSGGLDSTQALIVAVRAMRRLGHPSSNVLAYTMPGFATSDRTYDNAWGLMRSLGVSAAEIDIKPSCVQMLQDIEHPFYRGEPVHDVTFENVQAGERTSHLFRLANHHRALVVGTGDLSEMALGWATYGVGDQMSHYNVNTSVPKTLIQHLIRWVADTGKLPEEASEILRSILATEISPELVPGGTSKGPGDSTDSSPGSSEAPAQRTEDIIGPYELQDFHLYYTTRFGFRPSKVAYLAYQAWGDPETGAWPPGFPAEERRAYDLPTIKKWLEVFLRRFFQFSQFKRSASPNGPKVGSGGSLSPRGDWRAPSDASAEVWLAELERETP